MVFEAVKVALDPTPAQERLLLSHAGAARFAFNAGLAHVKAGIDTGAKPEWSYYALVRWWNANKDALAVNADGTPWWAENSKEAANTGLRSLAAALSNWSKSRRGERRGRKVGFPKFKAKSKAAPRFAYTTGAFGLIQGDPKALRLPKIGRVHCLENVTERVGGARVLRMTVSRRAGRWYAALTVEREEPAAAKETPRGGAVGIDLGIKTLATLSDGTVIKNPRYLRKAERKLKRAQKVLSRKTTGSKRRAKARAKVARLNARVANQRLDAMHKATTWLAETYSDISIEDLNVAGMARNHHLAKAIMDASFGEFRRQLMTSTCTGCNASRKLRQRKPPPHARPASPTRTGSTNAPTRPSPSTRSFADPGYTRKAVYANAPTAPTSALMRPTSAPPEGQHRSSRRSNAA